MNPTLDIPVTPHNAARLDLALRDALGEASFPSGDTTPPGPPGIRFTEAAGQDFLGAGLSDLPSVAVVGPVGNLAFCGADNCECTVEGDAGDALGHSLASGLVICMGSARDQTGAMARSGLIAVYGSAGDRTAVSLRGGDVLIRGNTGAQAGLGMRQGTLVIGGSAGPGLGAGMRGGIIFLRGDASEISPDVEEDRLRESDRLKLSLILLKSGIKSNVGKEFRVFRPRRGNP